MISYCIKPLSVLLLISGFLFSCSSGDSENHEKNGAGFAESPSPDSTFVVDIIAADYAYGMSSEIPSGWITFRMKNVGQEEHVAVIEKYVDSLSYNELSGIFAEATRQGDLEAYDHAESFREADLGGPGLLSPGHTGETTVYLEPGLYSISCGVTSSDGKYHYQKGMNRAFKVVDKNIITKKPESTVDITLSNFATTIEQPVGAGEHVFNVTFKDWDYHDVHLVKLAADQDLEQLKEWMNEVKVPSPFEFLGGTEQVPAGMSSTFKATLEPGRYAFVSHFLAASGMAKELNIPETGRTSASSNEMVNMEARIESDMKGTKTPKSLSVGRTPIVLKNTGPEDYYYFISSLKGEYSLEDYKEYIEGVYVFETIKQGEITYPENFIWDGTIEAGKQKTFNLKVEEKEYVLVGPIFPGKAWDVQWREQNMYHSIQGVSPTPSQGVDK